MRDEFNEALGLGSNSKTFFRAPEKIGALNNQIQDELNALNSKNRGLVIQRYFSKKDIHPYDEIEWEIRDAKITSAK